MTLPPDEIADRLYALPTAEFTAARDAAARELRKAGEREAAEEVKALRRPTAVAAAVNRLVREHRDEVEEFLRTAAVLRDAQFSGKGDLAAATRAEQEALERLLEAGGETTRQSLLAAAVDDEAARQLLEARLVRELEPRGFGTLLAHATPSGRRLEPPPKRKAVTPERTPAASERTPAAPERDEAPDRTDAPAAGRQAPSAKPGEAPVAKRGEATAAEKAEAPAADRAARAELLRDARDGLRDAQAALRAAETAESEAKRRWQRAGADLERASAGSERAREALERAKDALERAERHAGARDREADRDS